jgi:hypothetical protein
MPIISFMAFQDATLRLFLAETGYQDLSLPNGLAFDFMLIGERC